MNEYGDLLVPVTDPITTEQRFAVAIKNDLDGTYGTNAAEFVFLPAGLKASGINNNLQVVGTKGSF